MLSSSYGSELTTNLGSLLLGNITNAMLFGVTSMQTYAYWNSRGSDPIALVILLLLCWLIDILQLAFFSFTTYTYTIANFADPSASHRMLWSLPVLIFLTGASDLIVRSIFSYRIWKLSQHNVILMGCLMVNCVSTTTLDWAFAAMSFSVSNLNEWRSTRFSILLYTGLVSAIIGDILIAGSLCVILRIHVKEIPRSRTSNTIRLLIAYSIETCGLTSVCTLACLLTYATVRHDYAYISLYLLLSKFSLNALLATLNARRGLRAASEDSSQPSIPIFDRATESNSDTLGIQQSTYDGTLVIQSHAESERSATKDNCSTPEVNSYHADKARSLDTIGDVSRS